MKVEAITPILNVSDFADSVSWFERLGWRKLWDWGEPPTFGAVGNGKTEIFLCVGGQGGRGRGQNTKTFGEGGDQTADKGCWMSVWVDDVDAAHASCIEQNIEVMMPPADMPWGVREMHIRHPDGHVFRIGRGLECDEANE